MVSYVSRILVFLFLMGSVVFNFCVLVVGGRAEGVHARQLNCVFEC